MSSDERRIRVLIVDDEDSYRLPLKERLLKFLPEGEIEDVRNGDEAFETAVAREGGFDVALIDQLLYPPPGGIEVMRKLKDICPHLQAIMLTGWEMDAGLEALRAGAYRYISKLSLDVEELALMIEMAAEHQRLKKKDWLAKVLETSGALLSSLELDEVLGKILNGIKEIGYDRVRLYLLSEDRQALVGKMQAGGPEGIEAISLILAEDPYSRTTLGAKAPRIYHKDALGPDRHEQALRKEDVLEWIEIPLIARDEPIGKITVDNKFSRRKLFLDELEPLTVLANQAANAIYNARLFEQGQKDLANLSRSYDASSRIASSLDLDKTLELIINNAVVATQGCSACLWLIGEGGRPAVRKMIGYDNEEIRQETAVRPDGISMEVIHTTKRPFPMPDIEKFATIVNPGMIKAGFKAAICLPLLAKERAIGVMWVNYLETRPFPPEEVKLLQTFANQAAIAIENARLYAETEHRVGELALLNQVGHTLASSLELEQVPRTIMQQVAEALNVEAGSVMLLDEKTKELVIEAAVGPKAEKVQGQRFPFGQGIAGWVVQQGQPLLAPDAKKDSRFYPGVDEATGFVTRSLLAVPLLITNRVIGVIEAVNKTADDFGQPDLELLLAMAPAASIAVENARLYAEARKSARGLAQQMRRLTAVQRACTAISSSLSRSTILNITCPLVVELFGIDHSGLVIFDDDQEYGLVVAEYPDRGAVGKRIQIRGVSLEEQLIETRRPLIVQDVAGELLLGPVRDNLMGLGIQSILIAPLVLQDRAIGSLSLDMVKSRRNFSPEEVDLCQIIAAQAAVALSNANLLTGQERNLTVLQTLYDVLSDLRTTLDADAVLDSIANFLCRLFDLTTCTIGLLDESGERLEFKIHRGLDMPVSRRVADLPKDLWENLGQEKKRIVQDLSKRSDLAEQLERKDLRTFAALPLQGREKLLGILTMGSVKELNLTKQDWDLIQGLADQAALALENTKLYKLEQERARRWRTSASAGAKLARSLASPARELLEIIAQAACEIVGADCTVIYPYYAETKTLDTEHYAGYGLWKEFQLSGKRREVPGWAGQIIDSGHIEVSDVVREMGEEIAFKMRIVREEDIRAFAGIRLDAAGGPVGILYASFRQPHEWTEDELEAIQPFADQAALTIQHALFLRKRNAALRGIIEAAQTITSTLELGAVLERIVSTAKNTLQADTIALYPYDQSKDEFWPEFIHQGIERPDQPGWSPRSSGGARRVIASGEAHFSENSPAHKILGGEFVRQEKIVASAGLPLKVGRDILGVMFVNYREPHQFTHDDQDIIQIFANHAGIAIYNARLFDQTKKGQRRLQTAIDISKAFSGSLELDQVIGTLLDSLAGPFPQAHNRTVELYDPNTKRLIVHPASFKYYYKSEEEARRAHKPIPINKSIGGWVVTHKSPLNVPDVRKDKRYLSLISETRSQLTVPIMFGDDVSGVLTLESCELAAFGEEDERLLEALADQAGVAIENARRYHRLEEARETLNARTAIAWVGMAVSTWFHRVRGSAATVKDYTLLIREKLSDIDLIAPVSEDLTNIDAEVEKLLEISMRGGLPTKDDLELVYINQFLRTLVEDLCKSHKSVAPVWKLATGDEIVAAANSHWLAVGIEMLISNALRAMAGGGKLTIGTIRKGERIYIRIADTGPGIPEPLRDKLFKQPLTREDGALGSGMGLLMTKMILEAYNGDICLDERGKKGTTFLISLPEANGHV